MSGADDPRRQDLLGRAVEAACARALQIGNPTRKTVISILRRGLDQQPLEDPEPELPLVAHENVRGGEYFNRCEEQK